MTSRWIGLGSVCLGMLVAFGMAATPAAANEVDLHVKFANTVYVGSTAIPAGDYTIRALDVASDTHMLVFHSENGGGNVSVLAARVEKTAYSPDKSAVVLEQRGDALHVVRVTPRGMPYDYVLQTGGSHR